MIGGSDAGAHLDRMCGAPYTTEFLGDCLRGKQLIGLEEAIHDLTDVPARLFGLRDRGRLAEGWIADVVVLDPETIDAGEVEMVHDLPGGAGRLYADAVGHREGLRERPTGGRRRPGHRRPGRADPAIGPRHRDGPAALAEGPSHSLRRKGILT